MAQTWCGFLYFVVGRDNNLQSYALAKRASKLPTDSPGFLGPALARSIVITPYTALFVFPDGPYLRRITHDRQSANLVFGPVGGVQIHLGSLHSSILRLLYALAWQLVLLGAAPSVGHHPFDMR